MIEWGKRGRRCDTEHAERRVWKSKCGRYRVLETNIRYGRKHDSQGNYLGYPIIYSAMVHKELGWYTISTHRKRGPAIKQLEYYDQHGKPQPKKSGKSRRKVRPTRKAT